MCNKRPTLSKNSISGTAPFSLILPRAAHAKKRLKLCFPSPAHTHTTTTATALCYLSSKTACSALRGARLFHCDKRAPLPRMIWDMRRARYYYEPATRRISRFRELSARHRFSRTVFIVAVIYGRTEGKGRRGIVSKYAGTQCRHGRHRSGKSSGRICLAGARWPSCFAVVSTC